MIETGYLLPGFGESYGEFGRPLRLPASGLQLLERPIAGDSFDYIGPYPYVMCSDWGALAQDLPGLARPGAVSLAFVADPFQTQAVRAATRGWDLCRPFKTHHVIDLRRDWRHERPRTMRRLTRRALETHVMETVADALPLAAQFWQMYQTTRARHDVRGIQGLSALVIERQLALPGGLVITARDDAGLAGGILSFCHGETASLHLMFLSPRAHAQNTSHALIYTTLEALEARGLRHANLGGVAGNSDDAAGGLARFKMGWANETRSALLCGKVLDARRYRALCAGVSPGGYFPAYRAPGASGPAVPPGAD
ncbi:GNAT family N-acetyltransferase [Tropicibacter oceani]|uniref:GNAT family N-acetyltransferase n=1 Tax=Tropicibacter oceani TaxID=3058420 RepID=A0ABY8QQH7_9RHOB|nr:GNAT family N-acetyltransferase [Tropicibacter oceani]WGW06057.1 GNAT family N-acetyltransferase [Tropicibacter oceani]